MLADVPAPPDGAVVAGGADPDGSQASRAGDRPLSRRRPIPSLARSSRANPSRRGDAAATTSGGPGVLTVTAVVDGKTSETSGAEALKRLPELLRHPKASVWVDLSGPSREQVEEVGAALGLHPARSSRTSSRATSGRRSRSPTASSTSSCSTSTTTRELTASELDIVLGLGYLFTAHDSTWDPRATHHLRSGVEPILREGPDHLLWALADDVVDGYFPFADRLGYRHRRDPGRGRPEREARDARARCSR